MAGPPKDADFDAVHPGSLLPNACTPSLAGDRRFRGLKLHAPTEVLFDSGSRDPFFGAFARVLVAGIYRFDANYLDLRQNFLTRIVLVAVEARDHRAWSGTMEPIANAVQVPSPFDGMNLTAADFAGRSITGYFNPNLAQVLSLPEAAGEYLVYAVLGEYVSNVVRIRVRPPQKRKA